MARGSRKAGWLWVWDVYGLENGWLVFSLLVQGGVLGISASVLVRYLARLALVLKASLPLLPLQLWNLVLGFAVALTALLAVCCLVTAANLLCSDVIVCYETSHRMLELVEDWSKIDKVLDVGCGRGMLLNAVAEKLKKEGGGGRVVGVDLWLPDGSKPRRSMADTLKTSSREGTQVFVTCKTGDPRHLPFDDAYFDLVVSALCLHTLGRDIFGTSGAKEAAAAERSKGLLEIVRVLKPGGRAIIWDLHHLQEYRKKLEELGMQHIQTSEVITAYMVPTHVICVTKPD